MGQLVTEVGKLSIKAIMRFLLFVLVVQHL